MYALLFMTILTETKNETVSRKRRKFLHGTNTLLIPETKTLCLNDFES